MIAANIVHYNLFFRKMLKESKYAKQNEVESSHSLSSTFLSLSILLLISISIFNKKFKNNHERG
jgi:Na+/H+ antiporter NhaC